MSDKDIQDIKALKAWCKKARDIIGKGYGGDAKAMTKEIDGVSNLLKHLSRQTGDTDKLVFAAALDRFRDLSDRHKVLTEAYEKAVAERDKIKKKSGERAAADEAVHQAREAVRGLIAQTKALHDDLVADAPLVRAVHFFEVSMREMERQILDEKAKPLSDTKTLDAALQTIADRKREVEVLADPAQIERITVEAKSAALRVILEARQTSADRRKQEQRQSKARAGAEARLLNAQELLAELTSSGQLLPSIAQRFQSAIQQAELLHAQEKWIEGKELLKALPARADCIKAFKEAMKESAVDFGRELEEINVALAALKLQSDTATWERYGAATRLLQGRAGDSSRKGRGREVATLVADIRSHVAAMKQEIQDAVEAEARLMGLLPQLRSTAQRLEPIVPLNRSEENQRQIELIEVMQADRRWKEAEDTALLLQASMIQQDNPDHARWLRAKTGLGERSFIHNGLRLAVGNPQATPVLKDVAQSLLERIETSRLEVLEQARDWTSLMAVHDEADRFVRDLEKNIAAVKGFAAGRQEASEAVAPRLKRCADALFELERALQGARADVPPVVDPLKASLERLKTEWKRRVDSAADASDLNQPQIEQDLNALLQTILKANVGKNLAQTVFSQRDEAGRAAFEKARTALENKSLRPLDQVSVAEAAQLRAEISRLLAAAARDREEGADPSQRWSERSQALEAIGERATEALAEAAQQCADRNLVLGGKADAVALTLSAAKEQLRSKGFWASLAHRYEPMFTLLEEELEGLRQLLTTTNVTAAEGNARLLEDLKSRADELVRLAMHNEDLDGREGRVAAAEKRLKALRDRGLAKLAAESDSALSDQLKALQRDMFGMEPRVLNETLDEFTQTIDAADKVLTGIEKQKDKVAEMEANLRPRIAKLRSSTGVAAGYFNALLERVGAAVKQAGQPQELRSALLALEGIGNEVTEAEADTARALARQKLLNVEEHAQNRLKSEYAGRLETIESTILPRATKAVRAAGGDSGQLDELGRMVKQAKKLADGGNWEQALQTLLKTQLRVAEIEKNPAGTALGDMSALPKHLETFASQVGALREELGTFVETALTKVPESARDALRKPLTDAVQKVKTQLNPRLFDLYIPDITTKSRPMPERRAARDEALRRLRELQVFITTQPTVVKLADNPILPLRGHLRLVDSSLTRLEAHLRAAIR